jgi:uncharacterized protein (TIGR03437 family)
MTATKMAAVTRIVAAFLCMAAGLAYPQQYRVSTVVGGVLPLGPMPALEVSVGHVSGVATDRAGNVYFSSARGCVFQLYSNGSLRRVAGTCRAGFSGDGGPATSAQLSWPKGLAVDSNGNLYIADNQDCRIRKVTKDGAITTIAGTGSCRPSSDDGRPATNATLNYPGAIAVDPSGSIYVAEYDRVRKFSTGGTITTVIAGLSGSLAVDSSGSLYVASGTQVFKTRADGGVTTVAGKANTVSDSGDGGPALSATFEGIIGLAINFAGDLIIADGTIRRISADGIVHTIAGAACCDFPKLYRAWAGGVGAAAVDLSGNVYVGVLIGDVLRRITPDGIVTDVAGTDHPGYVGDGGPALEAQLSTPQDVAVDAAGNLYVADYGNSRVRKVSPAGVITTVAGNGTSGFSGDGGPATSAQLGGPTALAIDSAGNLFISDYLNNRIRKVNPDGIISTVAGTGQCCDLGDGGPATNAYVPMPHGIAVDSAGYLYIAEWPDSRIRKVTPSGTISTIAGNGTRGLSGDGGPATDGQLNLPWGVAVDVTGTVYVADNQNSRLRKVSPDGTITTMAGGANSGGLNLGTPAGIALDSAGNLFGSGGWKISAGGKLSALTFYNEAGVQVFASGIGITVDAKGNLFLVGGDQVRKLEPMTSPVSIDAVTNAASAMAGAIAPGEMIVIYAAGFGPQELTMFQAGNSGVATTLAGTRVFVNGTAAPVVYTSASQICAIVPYDVSDAPVIPYPGGSGPPGARSVAVIVEYQGQRSSPYVPTLAASSPGVFTLASNGRGPAVAYNEDGSLNSVASPAHPGEVITFYATGEGQTSPPGVDGQLGVATPPQPVAAVSVTIGGKSAAVHSAGGVPGQVAGLMRVQAVVPEGIASSGSPPLVLTVGDASSQTGVTVALSAN